MQDGLLPCPGLGIGHSPHRFTSDRGGRELPNSEPDLNTADVGNGVATECVDLHNDADDYAQRSGDKHGTPAAVVIDGAAGSAPKIRLLR